ncbi:MAG: helical backbone metal receptor [Oscillospiraceae bacterium]
MKKLLPLLLCITLLTACADEPSQSIPEELVVSSVPQTESEAQPEFFAQVCGVKLAKQVQTCVSLSPAVTEIIAELNLAERLIGTSTYCDYPEELNTAVFGSAENPDIKGIIGVNPDALLTLSPLSERDIYALEDAGIAVIQLEQPTDIEGYGKLYSDISACFFGGEAAAVISESSVEALQRAAENVQLGTFIYVTDKLTIAGKNTPENAFLSLCGKNLAGFEGYAGADEIEETPSYIIISDTLSESDLWADKALSTMLYNGAKHILVTSARFERPCARTADVYTQITEQLG